MTRDRDELRIVHPAQLDADGTAVVRLRIRTVSFTRTKGGLGILDDEEFIVRIGASALAPPTVDVDHLRFLGEPHVLQGQRLCIYLDASREWQPGQGMAGFLSRLWDWLGDAAIGAFDPSTAMFHAVGGVLHRADGTPTIVVRELGSRQMQSARLHVRTSKRLDLTFSASDGGLRVPVLTLSAGLPFGAASTLSMLLTVLDDPYLDRRSGRAPRVAPQSPALLTSLLSAAVRNPADSEQYFVLAVPHPAGGPHHLLGGRLPAATANAFRDIAKTHGTAINIVPATIDADIPTEWCTMSDERQDVTTRRDDGRPVNGFLGKRIHIWGCGGLGSWIAEFIARAGAASITLCDPGTITGGLLVRQNYIEADVGQAKADALGARLSSIRDDLTVVIEAGSVPADPLSFLNADLIIDATVSNAITSFLDGLAGHAERTAVIAQVATDARTGTLGIASICAPGYHLRPSEIDAQSGAAAQADGDLELYHPLWLDAAEGDELIPTRGCSVPTFHGSAADLAAVAATLVSLLGTHMQQTPRTISGTHVIALPHAADGPRHRFLVSSNVDSA